MTEEKTSRSWLRLWACAVDDDKLRLLAFEDRWHFIAILCCKAQGVLDTLPGTLDRRVAAKLGLQLREADEVKRRLEELDLIDENWQPVAWDKRQFISDQDSTAVRARNYRERKRVGVTEMIRAQGGECACCGEQFKKPYDKYVVMDHNHDTGENRALLCQSCNKVVGQVENGKDCHSTKEAKARRYLQRHAPSRDVTHPETDTEAEAE